MFVFWIGFALIRTTMYFLMSLVRMASHSGCRRSPRRTRNLNRGERLTLLIIVGPFAAFILFIAVMAGVGAIFQWATTVWHHGPGPAALVVLSVAGVLGGLFWVGLKTGPAKPSKPGTSPITPGGGGPPPNPAQWSDRR